MEPGSVNGELLYYAFLSGTIKVREQRNLLNEINVFPVSDGDTGNNLVATMNTVVEETKIQYSIKSTLESMVDAALTGARGNSGIIFAQFLNGIYEELRNLNFFTVATFAVTVKNAVPYAYKAILNPVEGTMVTVIRDWAEAVYKLKDEVKNFEEIITRSLKDAKKSLSNTPNLLGVLHKYSVVDSGASGFVSFLEGVEEFVKNKDITSLRKVTEKIVFEDQKHSFDEPITYRYCTEALLLGDNIDSDVIKDAIKKMGDSLIVAGNSSKFRVHIHTDEPDQVLYILKEKGKIIHQKIDDMKKQYQVIHKKHSKTAILTDSIADLPEELIEKYHIHVIPLNIMIEGSTFLDKLTIKPDKFYKMIDQLKEYPTSAQPSVKTVETIYSFLTAHYESIITIIVSKEMSGTFNTVQRVAEKFIEDGKKITVINSRLNSGAEGLLVLEAAKQLDRGKKYEEIKEMIEAYIEKTKIFVSVNTFKYMVRGGRVSPMKGMLGKLLNIKPIISINEKGEGIAFGKAFSSKANIQKIIKIVQKADQENKIQSYCIVHANDLIKAQSVSSKLTELLGQEPDYITEISPIVGLNAGIGSIAVAYISC